MSDQQYQRTTITIREAPAEYIAKMRAEHPDWNIVYRPERRWEAGLLVVGVFLLPIFGLAGSIASAVCLFTLAVRWKLVRR